METEEELETERQRLWTAVQAVLKRFGEAELDLDDTIEELRPIRMRVYKINCQLNKYGTLKASTRP